MNPSHLAEMFERAISVPPAQRAAWLQSHCGVDPTLHSRLASLLRAHEQAGGFLESVPRDLIKAPALSGGRRAKRR